MSGSILSSAIILEILKKEIITFKQQKKGNWQLTDAMANKLLAHNDLHQFIEDMVSQSNDLTEEWSWPTWSTMRSAFEMLVEQDVEIPLEKIKEDFESRNEKALSSLLRPALKEHIPELHENFLLTLKKNLFLIGLILSNVTNLIEQANYLIIDIKTSNPINILINTNHLLKHFLSQTIPALKAIIMHAFQYQPSSRLIGEAGQVSIMKTLSDRESIDMHDDWNRIYLLTSQLIFYNRIQISMDTHHFSLEFIDAYRELIIASMVSSQLMQNRALLESIELLFNSGLGQADIEEMVNKIKRFIINLIGKQVLHAAEINQTISTIQSEIAAKLSKEVKNSQNDAAFFKPSVETQAVNIENQRPTMG